MAEKLLNSRIINKHDTAANWAKATNFIPKSGELIIYTDGGLTTGIARAKIGDGITLLSELPWFITDQITSDQVVCDDDGLLLSTVLDTYILNIDYSLLAFDTSEIVISSSGTTAKLGTAILGKMLLGT